MSYRAVKINDVQVKRVPLFPEHTSNIFLSAKRKSGMTNTIYKIIQGKCCKCEKIEIKK